MSELEEHFATIRHVSESEGRTRRYDLHCWSLVTGHLPELEVAVAHWRALGSPMEPPTNPAKNNLSGGGVEYVNLAQGQAFEAFRWAAAEVEQNPDRFAFAITEPLPAESRSIGSSEAEDGQRKTNSNPVGG